MDKRRYDAVYQSCKELEEICPQFKTEEALEFAKDSGTLYKAHVMRVLWQYGLSDGMYNTVYCSLFGLRPVRGKILHTPVYETVDTILNLIQECRGGTGPPQRLPQHAFGAGADCSRAAGRRGDRPPPATRRRIKPSWEQLAAEYGLIVTGGTDYHGMLFFELLVTVALRRMTLFRPFFLLLETDSNNSITSTSKATAMERSVSA